MGYKMPGVETGGLPIHLVKPLMENREILYFVETGTANGDSARLAATLFNKVWTIEVIKDRPEIHNAPNNVSFLIGDSSELLPEIIEELNTLKGCKAQQYVLFYLDAHYCDGVPNESDYPECPLLEELEAVSMYGDDAIIIIDDARLFLGQPPYPNNPKEWPSIIEIFILLKENFPYHHITITDDYVLCIPLHVRDVIDKEWRDRFDIRYPNESDKLKTQVKDVYNALINYIK